MGLFNQLNTFIILVNFAIQGFLALIAAVAWWAVALTASRTGLVSR